MKPSELYKREPESISVDLKDLKGYYFNHIPEINEYANIDSNSKNDRVEIKIYKHFDYDYRRFWRLASVWFDGKPVMIIQNAGREGDDHKKRFITDEQSYIGMIKYIITLVEPEFETKIPDIIDLEDDIEKLTCFYDGQLDGYFQRY